MAFARGLGGGAARIAGDGRVVIAVPEQAIARNAATKTPTMRVAAPAVSFSVLVGILVARLGS